MEYETFSDKLWRKCKAEPFVPLGLVTTSMMLAGGLNAFRQRKAYQSQLFMRARCVAQLFTITAFAIGFFLKIKDNENNNSVDQRERVSDALLDKLVGNIKPRGSDSEADEVMAKIAANVLKETAKPTAEEESK